MKENTIINIISTVYSKIAFFFWSIIIFISLIFGIFLYGIKIEHLQTKELSIEKLYIKWDEKFIISADKIKIFEQKKQTTKKREPINLKFFVKSLWTGYHIFQSIDLKNITYKDIQISILYKKGQKGFINLDSDYSHLKSELSLNDHNLHVKINNLTYLPLKLKAQGDILFEKSNKTLTANLDINLTNQAFFHLDTELKNNSLHYQAKFIKPIQKTAPILKLLNLPKPVQYWAITAIDAKDLSIQQLYGDIDLNNPQDGLKNIYVKAIANDLKYIYNPKLAPIQTQYTLLEFKNGILYIYPHNATTYGYDLEKSYLKIDFSHQPEELLTLYLRFQKGMLDKNILTILSTYGINVPLEQKEGTTKTDLTISVSLRNINVNAKGNFFVEKGRFFYLGMDIDVKNVLVHLENSHIIVNKMKASLQNMITSDVDIDLQLSKHKGKINFFINKIQLPSYKLSLITKPSLVSYIINKEGNDTIKIPQTQWNIASHTLKINPLDLDFNFKNYAMKIPLTKISIKNQALGYFSGQLNLKQKKSKIIFDIVKYKNKNLQLAQSDLSINIQTDQNRTTITSNPIHFYIKDKNLHLGKLNLSLQNNILQSNKFNLRYDDHFHTFIKTKYNLKKKKGFFTLFQSQYNLKDVGILFSHSKPLLFKYSLKDIFTISNIQLKTFLHYDKKALTIKLLSLKDLLPYSPLLKKYKITNGTLLYNSKKGLNAEISSLYKLMRIREKPINNYKITSSINKSKISINNHIFIDYTKNIKVICNNIGIDIDEMQKIIKLMDKSKKNTSDKNLFIKLTNGYLYITKSRRILYDTLHIQSINDIITAQMKYKNGKAGFRYHNNNFYLYGSNFNDTFMSNLFLQSKFKKGKLNFNIVGNFNNYKGIFEISNTTVLDYKILTNILAFIDTVPSLMTFSLPKYSKEGLPVHKAYASFYYQNGIFTFDNVSLNSDQIKIVGAGTASYIQNFINFVFQLKTNIASKASKIPIVGYILFDGKTISTTLKVDGKLTDPKISTMIAQSIIVAPINIIKRTILLPVHLFGLDKKEKKK